MSLLKENFKTFYFVKAPEKCAVGTEEGVVREGRGELLLIHTHVEHLAVRLHSNVSWQAASQPLGLLKEFLPPGQRNSLAGDHHTEMMSREVRQK